MNNRILIVGEAYGAEEEKQQKTFVGKSGQFLRDALEEAGFDLSLIDFTNVCMFRPPGNRKPTQTEIRAELPRLQKELKDYKHIILAGVTALNTVGRWFQDYERSYSVWHPAYCLRGGINYLEYVAQLEAIRRVIGKL